jgi:hypothetical protein
LTPNPSSAILEAQEDGMADSKTGLERAFGLRLGETVRRFDTR